MVPFSPQNVCSLKPLESKRQRSTKATGDPGRKISPGPIWTLPLASMRPNPSRQPQTTTVSKRSPDAARQLANGRRPSHCARSTATKRAYNTGAPKSVPPCTGIRHAAVAEHFARALACDELVPQLPVLADGVGTQRVDESARAARTSQRADWPVPRPGRGSGACSGRASCAGGRCPRRSTRSCHARRGRRRGR